MIDHQRVSGLFLEACELSPAERAAFLDRACGGDAALRAEVEAMLEQDARAGGTEGMTARVLGAAGEGGPPAPAPAMPARIGPYRILDRLGEGAMGIVYRAEQTEPIRREVALKVIRGGADSAVVVARFESERQTLALMDHPNIARVLDAGSDAEGRPYFVMERIEGELITSYCRSHRLDARARLKLFLDVCRGVRHAHRRGIIHRDLKPSNVLVTEEAGAPVPKVIDFSIAKALEGSRLGTEFRTRTGQVVGTLEYMSPEQARGDVAAVDTRADVWALGVILYELLAERLPFDLANLPLHEAVRRICEEPPFALRGTGTTATGRLDADLETITGKCLQKEPDRRYGSAAELVEDLERYLDSRPIQARPPSTVYLFRKLVARHRAVFAGVTLAMALLLMFSVVVTIQLRIQRRERARAESEAAKSERVIEFLQQTFVEASRKLSHDAKVKDALDLASKKLASGTTEEAEADAAIRMVLARAWLQFAQYEKSEALCREAIALLERRLGPSHPDVGSAYQELGGVLFYAGQYEKAVAPGEHALAIHEAQRPRNPVLIGQDLSLLAMARLLKGELDTAESMLRREIQLYETDIPRNDQTTNAFTIAKENLANLLQRRGRVAEATEIMKEVLEIRRKAGIGDIGLTQFNVAFLLDRQGEFDEAEPLFREHVDNMRRDVGPGHPNLGDRLRGLAGVLHRQGRLEEAEAALREAVAIFAKDQEHYLYSSLLGMLAEVLRDQDRLPEATQIAEGLLRTTASKLGEEHVGTTRHLARLGQILETGGRMTEAEEAFRKCVEIRTRSLPADDLSLGSGLLQLAAHLAGRERFEEALPLGERALSIMKLHLDEDLPELVMAKGWHAVILDGLGRYSEAEEIRADALARAQKINDGKHPSAGWLLHGRASALRRQARDDDALPVAREALSRRKALRGQDKAIADSQLELAEILLGRKELRETQDAAREALAIWAKAAFVDPTVIRRAREIADGVDGLP